MPNRSQFDDSGWPDQWQRVQRWYKRVEAIRVSPPAKGEPGEPDALDYLLAFFVFCFHLGDWLEHDRRDPHAGAISYLHSDPDLLICRDLANGWKHCVLDPARKPTWPNAVTTASPVRHSGRLRVEWRVEVQPGDFRDVFSVAQRCMEAWRRYIAALPVKLVSSAVPPGAAS